MIYNSVNAGHAPRGLLLTASDVVFSKIKLHDATDMQPINLRK